VNRFLESSGGAVDAGAAIRHYTLGSDDKYRCR
jgi:hypothetical protein